MLCSSRCATNVADVFLFVLRDCNTRLISNAIDLIDKVIQKVNTAHSLFEPKRKKKQLKFHIKINLMLTFFH